MYMSKEKTQEAYKRIVYGTETLRDASRDMGVSIGTIRASVNKHCNDIEKHRFWKATTPEGKQKLEACK